MLIKLNEMIYEAADDEGNISESAAGDLAIEFAKLVLTEASNMAFAELIPLTGEARYCLNELSKGEDYEIEVNEESILRIKNKLI